VCRFRYRSLQRRNIVALNLPKLVSKRSSIKFVFVELQSSFLKPLESLQISSKEYYFGAAAEQRWRKKVPVAQNCMLLSQHLVPLSNDHRTKYSNSKLCAAFDTFRCSEGTSERWTFRSWCRIEVLLSLCSSSFIHLFWNCLSLCRYLVNSTILVPLLNNDDGTKYQ
jgi:hypothetical protein